MQKILFVCLGNICRSPLGEGIMLHFIEEKNLEKQFQVDSAGTAGYHINEAPDHRTIANAKKNGVDISKLRARKFSAEDFDAFDKIYVMDDSNYENVVAVAKKHYTKKQSRLFIKRTTPPSKQTRTRPLLRNRKGF